MRATGFSGLEEVSCDTAIAWTGTGHVGGDAVEAESESVDRSFDTPLRAYSALLRMRPAAALTSSFHTLLGGLDKG